MALLIKIPEQVGRCRWCHCTERDPCDEGCGWANRARTLCTGCAQIDRLVQSARGRRELADLMRGLER